jgi:hypothetical protein
MKLTTVMLVAALPFAAAALLDGVGPRERGTVWSDPTDALEVMQACETSGGRPEVCACTAKHVLVGSPRTTGPSVAAAGALGGNTDPIRSYRESCERWARILGLVEEDRGAAPLAVH